MKAKKVIIIYSGARYFGGIETYLTKFFEFYNLQKIQPLLVGEWDFEDKINPNLVKKIRIPGYYPSFGAISQLSKLVREEKADLIISQAMVANFYARLVVFKTKVPLLTVIHSDFKLDYPSFLKRSLYFLTDRLLRRFTTHYIAVSNYLKEKLMASGIKEGRIDVIYNGIEPLDVKPKEEGKEIIVGSVGRLHKVKGYDNLIKAIFLLRKENIRLFIWGDGPEKTKLLNLIALLNLENKVSLKGFTDDISKDLSEIDIYVQSSKAEGFGLSVVEAMSAGKPVIVTPAGSLKELIGNGETGIITKDFSPESISKAIQKLAADRDFRDKLARRAKEEAGQKFSLKKWLEKTTEQFIKTAK